MYCVFPCTSQKSIKVLKYLWVIMLFISFCASVNGQLPYIVSYTDIQEELKEIWHDAENNTSYLITVDRLCILEPGDLACRNLGIGKNMLFHNQTYDRFTKHPIFLGNYGGFYEIKNRTIKSNGIDEKYPNAASYQDGNNLWIAGHHIYKYSEGNIDTIPIIMNSKIPFWDIRKHGNGDLWFVNHGVGAYIIDQQDKMRRLSTLNGLPTNDLTSIHISKDNDVYLGYKGGFAIVQESNRIETFNLRNHIGNEPIKELETDDHGFIWFLTDKKLGRFHLESKAVSIIPTNEQEDFIIHTIEYNSNKDLMLIGTSKGLYISSTEGSYFHGSKTYSKGSMYYFGDDLLLSGTSEVKSFNPTKGVFEKSEYRPVMQSFPTKNGDFWIADKRNVLLLDKQQQKVSKTIRKPAKKLNQITEIDDSIYFCHDNGISIHKNGRTHVLVSGDEAFYNVLSCQDKKYAVSEQGIYLIGDNVLHHQSEIEGNEKMLKSNKQFFIDDESLLIPAQRAIIKVVCTKDDIAFEFLPSLENILDFHVHQDNIYILHSDRLMMYKRDNYLKDPYDAYCAIPVNADENSRLFVDDQEKIWLQNGSGLANINRNHDKICNILKVEEDEEPVTVAETKSNSNNIPQTLTDLDYPKLILFASIALIGLLLLKFIFTKRDEV